MFSIFFNYKNTYLQYIQNGILYTSEEQAFATQQDRLVSFYVLIHVHLNYWIKDQKQKRISYMIPYIWSSKLGTSNLCVRIVVPRRAVEGGEKVTGKGHKGNLGDFGEMYILICATHVDKYINISCLLKICLFLHL